MDNSETMYTEQNLDSRGTATGAGVRKVNERVVQEGRGLVITDENISHYNWDDIPAGSLLVNPKTGAVQVKIEGASNWQPGLIKNDGTICISQDSVVVVERFEVVNPLLDESTFTYQDITEIGKIVSGKRSVTSDGYQKYTGYTFTLTRGEYMEDRNLLAVSIVHNPGKENETTVLCDVVNGSLIEDDFYKFTVVNQNIQSGDQIVARYFRIVRIGNPYPRWFVTDRKPDTLPDGLQASEEGDMWLDYSQTVDETSNEWLEERSDMLGWGNVFQDDGEGNKLMPNLKVEWSNIQHRATNLKELGIEDEVRQLIKRAIANDIKYENIHFIEKDGQTAIEELSVKSTPSLPHIDWDRISNRPESIRAIEALSASAVDGRFTIKDELITVEPGEVMSIYWPRPLINHPLAYVVPECTDGKEVKFNYTNNKTVSTGQTDGSFTLDEALDNCYVDAGEYGIKIGYEETHSRVRIYNSSDKKVKVHIRGTAEGKAD